MIEIKAEKSPDGLVIDLDMEGPLPDMIVGAAGILRAMYDEIGSNEGTGTAETFRRVLMSGLNKEGFWYDQDLIVTTTEEGVPS